MKIIIIHVNQVIWFLIITIIYQNWVFDFFLGKTLNVKILTHVRQTKQFFEILDNCSTYFFSLYYYFIFKNIHIFNWLYINYNLICKLCIILLKKLLNNQYIALYIFTHVFFNLFLVVSPLWFFSKSWLSTLIPKSLDTWQGFSAISNIPLW